MSFSVYMSTGNPSASWPTEIEFGWINVFVVSLSQASTKLMAWWCKVLQHQTADLEVTCLMPGHFAFPQ